MDVGHVGWPIGWWHLQWGLILSPEGGEMDGCQVLSGRENCQRGLRGGALGVGGRWADCGSGQVILDTPLRSRRQEWEVWMPTAVTRQLGRTRVNPSCTFRGISPDR